MNVKITRTTAIYPTGIFVQWDIDSSESGVHLVDVARSGGPNGPWITVASALPNTYQYYDTNLNLPDVSEGLNFFSMNHELYYQITVIPPSGIENKFTSPPTAVEAGLDKRMRLIKRKILRDSAIALKAINGIEIVALKRKNWGMRCSKCWDPVTKEGTIEHCDRCYGTTFEGGYWNPVLIRGLKDPAPTSSDMAPEGLSEKRMTQITILDFPQMEPDDLLVDLRNDDRYFVQVVTPREIRSVLVNQSIVASLIARDAVEYTIPIDLTSTPGLY